MLKVTWCYSSLVTCSPDRAHILKLMYAWALYLNNIHCMYVLSTTSTNISFIMLVCTITESASAPQDFVQSSAKPTQGVLFKYVGGAATPQGTVRIASIW